MENLRLNQKYEKVNSLHSIEQIGLPVLPFLVLDEKSFEEQIRAFAEQNGLEKVMIRTDGAGLKTPSILDAEISDQLFEQIRKLFLEGYLVFVQHPGNIYRNLHSFNILLSGDGVYIEIVGPGFTAQDLNRHNMAPHERFVFDSETAESIHDRIVDREGYLRDREERLAHSDREQLEKTHSFLLKYSEYQPLGS